MKSTISGNNLYVINCPINEESLCHMEMKYLFHIDVNEKYFYSDIKVKPSRSPYIRHVLSILYHASSLNDLVKIIELNKVAFNNFKFVRFKIKNGELGYDDWIESVTKIANVIEGEASRQNPAILLGATKVHGDWIFGIYERNDNKWMEHNKKPNTNSHSLGLVVSRTLVNIAVGTNPECSLVDPCCGVGTVIIEALSMGINVKGYEINLNIAKKAKANLEFFGYENVIMNADMHNINEHFDVAIIDIPYGLMTPFSEEQQIELIKTARRITNKLVLVTITNMDEALRIVGFNIVDRCQVNKGNFKRYITICN